ncbi:branched-chain amino acid ABC transporter permease [Bordetella sp. FB-8]|uniref:branched-chain amino acid ABC transporter permease n=1 Tax=Bordetella sp. FB-8 TaxID=1159870 RepID=UPI0003622B4E|nr:branched-chain amino acid ABC transporter permease [Bordetella sp. FB-8]
MHIRKNAQWVLWLVLLTMPYWITPMGGYTDLATRLLVIGLAALATNLLIGHTGVMSFGHAAYFGLGAYATGLTLKYLLPSTPVALLVGILVGTLGGMLIGYLIVRLRGIYFALATIAFGQVFYFIAFRWNSVTGGDNGLRGFQRLPMDLGFMKLDIPSSLVFYYVVLAILAVCAFAMATILRSPFGHTLQAIRENERRAQFLSIPVNRHIWIAYTISCFFVSIAGSLYALLNNFASPHDLYWTQSGDFVLMAVIGGMRSFWGPLLGATIFVVAQDYLSGITEDWMFFIGLIFVLVVLLLPRGIAGLFQRRAS